MKQIKITSLIIAAAFSLTSCLKEHPMNIDTSNGPKNQIEFANSGSDVADFAKSTYPRYTADLGKVLPGKSVNFNVNVGYSGVDVAPQDITVNLALDQATLTQFNTENGTSFEIPSTDLYKFPTSIVIKKGEHIGQAQVTVTNTSNFDFNKNYALPLKITSATTGAISGNYGKAVFSFSARNQYDGVYTMNGTMTDVANSGLTGYYPADMQLITFTGNSVALWDPNVAKNYGHPILSGGSGSYYGSFTPVFYFDASGNVTKVENKFGQPSGNGRSARLDPTGVNKNTFNADGSIKQIQVKYIMDQVGVAVPRTFFDETFVYKGVR